MSEGPVVVIILSHKDPSQVRRLVSRLLEGNNSTVVIHHDPRGPELALPAHDRVHVVPDPMPGSWGRFALAEVMLRSLAFARARVPELGWALLVSGQDYPCRSMLDIEQELADTTANAFARHYRIDGDPAADVHPWQAVVRRRYLRRLRLPGTHRSVPFPRIHPFGGNLRLYAGDMWFNLDTHAIEHVLSSRPEMSRAVRHLQRSPIPDEALIPTLLLNGNNDLNIVSARRRYLRWAPRDRHPAVLGSDDLIGIRNSDDFFARKMDPAASASLLDGLDEIARERTPPRSRS